MRIRFDKETDTLYIRIDERPIVGSEEVRPGVILDFDDAERVVGMEVLGFVKRGYSESLQNLQFQTA